MKVKIKDFNGKVKEFTKVVRAEDHLLAQQKYKSSVFNDKTKYCRKQKHKQNYLKQF